MSHGRINAKKSVTVKTEKTVKENETKEKNRLVEKTDDSTPMVSEEKLHKRSVPVKPEDLNSDKAKLGKKCSKPWDIFIPVSKVNIPAEPVIKETLSEDDFEELDLGELDKKVEETKETHDGVVTLLEKTEKVLDSDLDDDDLEILDKNMEKVEEKKEDKKEEKVEKNQTTLPDDFLDFEIPDEFKEIEVTKEEEKTGLEEVKSELKKVELETDVQARKAEIERKIAEARKNKKPLDDLFAQLKEANKALMAFEHRREAEQAIALYSRNVTKYHQTSLEAEEAKLTLSDKDCRLRKENLRTNIKRLSAVGNIASVQKALPHLRAYANADHYRIGHKKEAELLKKAINALREIERDKNVKPDSLNGFSAIKAEFEKLSKGELDIQFNYLPEGTKKIRCVGRQPKDDMKNAGFLTKLRQSILFSSVLCKWVDRTEEPLFAHEPTVNDLRQGKVSNCYMVSAITGLIQYDSNIIKRCMREESDGTVTVRLFRNGEPVYVNVDKRTPQLVTGGAILTDGPLWMNILERAIAVLGRAGNRGYGSLWYGDGNEIVSMLTGAKASQIVSIKSSQTNDRKPDDKQFDKDEKTKLFLEICSAKKLGRVYSCGTYNSSGAGLNDGHAYTLLDGREIHGERYVLLRNPYANMSLKYNEKGDRSKSTTFASSTADATCGQFLMKFDEFLRDFAAINYVTIAGAPGVPAVE